MQIILVSGQWVGLLDGHHVLWTDKREESPDDRFEADNQDRLWRDSFDVDVNQEANVIETKFVRAVPVDYKKYEPRLGIRHQFLAPRTPKSQKKNFHGKWVEYFCDLHCLHYPLE